MSKGQPLPSVLRATTMERPVNQDVNTDLLFPVNFSQNGAKFVFDKKGVLDSNSQLNLAQIVVNSASPAVDTNSVLPTSTGALAMIRRAYLEIGGRRVSDLTQVGQYATWKRLHFSNEYKKGIVQPKQGGNDVFIGSASARIRAANDVVSQASRGFDMPVGTLGRESSEFAVNDYLTAGFGTQDTSKTAPPTKPKQRITRDANTTPSFAVGLGQLIPFLSSGVQLPLFAIREEVSLVLEWADNSFGHRFYPPSVDSAGVALTATNCSSTMIENKCFMCVDYLFYPDLMAGLAEEIMQRGGYDVPYTEILTQENMLITDGAATSFNNNFQLALGGKKVKHIIVQKELVDGANESIVNIGRYNSLGFRLGEQIQLNIDSNNWYSQPLSNASLQKHEADMVEAMPLQLCDYRWSWFNQVDSATGATPANGEGLTDRQLNTYAQTAECGSQHWIGIKLENSFGQGRRMSNLPVIYTTQSRPGVGLAADDAGTQRRVRFFTGIQKVLNISQGIATQIE